MGLVPEYLVTICGYEGIEAIFGPFVHEEAFEFFMELKRITDNIGEDEYEYQIHRDPAWFDKWEGVVCDTCANFYYWDSRSDRIAYKYDIGSMPRDSDRICIQKAYGVNKTIRCACEDFPERPEIEKRVFY